MKPSDGILEHALRLGAQADSAGVVTLDTAATLQALIAYLDEQHELGRTRRSLDHALAAAVRQPTEGSVARANAALAAAGLDSRIEFDADRNVVVEHIVDVAKREGLL